MYIFRQHYNWKMKKEKLKRNEKKIKKEDRKCCGKNTFFVIFS